MGSARFAEEEEKVEINGTQLENENWEKLFIQVYESADTFC